MSGTQKALYLPARAGKWVVGEAPIYRPGPKDVLVKVVAAGLNPLDWKLVDTPFSVFIPSYPFISGSDGAGIVEEVGAEVTTLVKGDKILFQGYFANEQATFQQYCLVEAALAAKIPDNISFDEAASVPLGLGTVVLALYNHAQKEDQALRFTPRNDRSARLTPPWAEGGTTKYAGKAAFIIGGASSVGQYAIQVAKLANFSPIITTASPHNTAYLTSLGATHIVDRALDPSAILAELPKLAAGKPIELVFDSIALPETQVLAYQAAAPGANVILLLPDVIPAEVKKPEDGKRVTGVAGNVHFPDTRACGEELFARLTEWLKKGIIKPNKVEVLPNGLAGIPDGLARLEAGKVSATKLIARPQETP
ncbi:GroES-like protein [Cerioporus squamosus]|nr:GroES-like protein [Cerioporus squamosus]